MARYTIEIVLCNDNIYCMVICNLFICTILLSSFTEKKKEKHFAIIINKEVYDYCKIAISYQCWPLELIILWCTSETEYSNVQQVCGYK